MEEAINLRVGAHRSWGDDVLVNLKDLKVTVDFKACNLKESKQVCNFHANKKKKINIYPGVLIFPCIRKGGQVEKEKEHREVGSIESIY